MKQRKGMTLIEVMIALVIMTSALLSMGMFITRFSHAVSESTVRTSAAELAADRIETVKTATVYKTIDSIYAKTETSISGYTGFTRQTLVQRVGGGTGDIVDYKVITVVVTSRGLTTPVKKTTIIADF